MSDEEAASVSEGVFKIDGRYHTLNLVPGTSVYGEDLLHLHDAEYRQWDPNRSKLAAFLVKQGSLPFQYDSEVLYLGAGDGTTVSHISDILTDGKIYAVEVAKNPYRNLLQLSKKRKNIFPILSDARRPEEYRELVNEVDLVYQDIAQRDQVDIFIKNLDFLKEGHHGLIAVKSRSIDVSSSPGKIYQRVKKKLKDNDYEVVIQVDISRWQKDHAVLVVEK
ncbi:MAG: fibrillarin-like rRNA/tRNA 2'-O-methyltransferase [Candidatus Thermoplasmatota archaeon]